MGQKVNPHGARVGVIKGWDARWFADKKEFANYIAEDDRLRKYLKKKLYSCLLYTSPSPRDSTSSRMPSSA